MSEWVIGIDLGGTKIELGLVNPANKIVKRLRIPTLPQEGSQRVVDRIVQAVNKLKLSLPDEAQLAALGICSPGPVDHETGFIVDPPNLVGLHNTPLRDMLETQLKIPVALEHDAKAAALGEYHYGIGRDETSMVYVVVGTGVGAAIINDGELLRGLHNFAGEIGHITIDRNGERCSCGRYGCAETFLSGPWLARNYHALLEQHNPDSAQKKISAEQIVSLAIKGDSLAQTVMKDAADVLALTIGTTAMMLNIDLFVIGGSVAKAGEVLIEPARRSLPKYTYNSVGSGIKIFASELDTDAPILGCAWLARQTKNRQATIVVKEQPHTLSQQERHELEQVEGIVFDIQRFSLHDGPGIRTNVFLKGCALRCEWCANPESQSPQPQLALSAHQCIECGLFEDNCKDNWQSFIQTQSTIDKFAPRAEVCPPQAIRWIGIRRKAGDVIKEVKRDQAFYGENGGLTITGGDPTFQPRMAEALARLAKADGLSVTIETAGHTRWKVFESLIPHLDLILFDIKHIDPQKHKKFTGIDNELILSNLARLVQVGASVQVRVPLIPDFNANDDDIRAIAEFVSNLDGLEQRISLLPYHTMGRAKYRALARDYPWDDHSLLADEEVQRYTSIVETYGISVSIGS